MDAQTVFDVISSVGLLATLVLLVFQTRDLNRQTKDAARATRDAARATRLAVYQSANDNVLELDRTLLDWAHLRPYFYEGLPLPEDAGLRSEVMAAAELVIDTVANLVFQSEEIVELCGASWGAWYEALFAASPAVSTFWEENRLWYEHRLHVVLDPIYLKTHDSPLPPCSCSERTSSNCHPG